MEQHLRVGVRLRVSGQNQPAAVGGGSADIDHLNRDQFFQHGRGREAGGMRQQVLLQRDLKTVGQERTQDVRVGALFELMMNRADAQFALERSKHGFDLRQLDVARPQHRGVFIGQVGAEQVVPVPQLRRVELGLVDAEAERLARHRLLCISMVPFFIAACDVVGQNIVYDAPTTYGGSGGAVPDAEGQVIAINYAGLESFSGAQFGIRIRFVRTLLEESPRGSNDRLNVRRGRRSNSAQR